MSNMDSLVPQLCGIPPQVGQEATARHGSHPALGGSLVLMPAPVSSLPPSCKETSFHSSPNDMPMLRAVSTASPLTSTRLGTASASSRGMSTILPESKATM